MHAIKYSLLTLLAVTAVIAIALVALRTGDWFWSRFLFTLTLGIHLAAVLGVFLSTGRPRAFWIGFAVFGWACWFVTNSDSLRIAEHQLFSRQIHTMLQEYVPKGNDGIVIESHGSRITIFSHRQIVHSTFGLLFALVGGMVGVSLYANACSRPR